MSILAYYVIANDEDGSPSVRFFKNEHDAGQFYDDEMDKPEGPLSEGVQILQDSDIEAEYVKDESGGDTESPPEEDEPY